MYKCTHNISLTLLHGIKLFWMRRQKFKKLMKYGQNYKIASSSFYSLLNKTCRLNEQSVRSHP